MQKNCTVAGCRSLIRKKNTDMVNGSAYLLLLLPPSLYHAFPPCCSSSLRFLHFFSSSPFPSPSLFNPIEVFYFFLFLGANASIREFLGEELCYGWLCNLGACVILFVIDGRDDCYTTSVWVWSEGALVLQIGSKGIIFLFREVVTLIL